MFPFTEEFQLISAQEMGECEYHHYTVTSETTDLGKQPPPGAKIKVKDDESNR